MEDLFIGYPGGNCSPAENVSGYVTEFHAESKHLMGAFIKCPVLDGSGPMLYARLGHTTRENHRKVLSVRSIEREEFDRLNEIDQYRRELGWR